MCNVDIILLVLGIIGEYIGRIYMCLNHEPQFIIREIYDFGNNKDKGVSYELQKK